MVEEHKVLRAQVVSLDPPGELDPQVVLEQLERTGPLASLEKLELRVSQERRVLWDVLGSTDPQALLETPETRVILEKMGLAGLLGLQVLLAPRA